MKTKSLVINEIAKQLRASLCIDEKTPDDSLLANIEIAISRLGVKINEDDDRLLLAELRAAIGVGETVMQEQLVERAREIRQGFDRYKKVICLTPADFAQLKKIAFLGKTKFDTLIDNLNLPN